MAKDRTQVQDLAGPFPLQPESTPVDTYHRPVIAPPKQVDRQLGDVAQALQDIHPSLKRFTDTSVEMDVEAGRTLAAKNKAGFKEAVDKGIIKPGQNPWVAKGYKEQLLSLQAQDYDSALRTAWTASGVNETDDPQAFHNFVDNFSKTYVGHMDLQNDPTFGQVFVPQMLKSQENLQQQHTAYQQERIVEKAKDATYRNVQSLIDSHFLFADNDHLQAAIKQNADSMVANGLPGSDVNRLVTDAISDKAVQAGDATILSLGKNLDTGNGPLGKTQYAQQKFDEAEQRIFSVQREKDNHEWSQYERNKKMIGEDLMKQSSVRIGQDPTGDISDLTKQAEAIDPEVAKKMREYKDYVQTLDHKVYPDREALDSLYSHIYDGSATAAEIHDLVVQGKLSPDQVPFAYRDMAQAEKHKDLLEDPVFSRTIEETGGAIAGGEFVATKEDKQKAIGAKNLLRQSVIDFKEKNPNATKVDVYEQLVKNQGIILKGILPGNSTAVPPGVSGQVLNPKPTEAKPAEAPKPVSKPLYTAPDELKKDIEEYNSTQGQGRLAIRAEARGQTVEEFIADQRKMLPKKASK